MELVSYFQAVADSSLSQAISTSTWAFAVIESVHLLALAVIGGAVLVVDLRLLGWGLRDQRVADLARDAFPWLVGSLIVMLVTGYLLMASLAYSKYFINYAFQLKMWFLFAAILYTYTIRRSFTRRDESRINPAVAKIIAIVSILLWSGVGIMGRGIGFY